jgi:hypothetical protein
MCRMLTLKDGTHVLANMKEDAVLTPEEEAVLVEWVQFVRDRAAEVKTLKEQRDAKNNGRKGAGRKNSDRTGAQAPAKSGGRKLDVRLQSVRRRPCPGGDGEKS